MVLGPNIKIEKKKRAKKSGQNKKIKGTKKARLTEQIDKVEKKKPKAKKGKIAEERQIETKSQLIFALHGPLYAVETNVVREIIWLPELTPIEEAPGYIAGVFNLRGRIVPVVDLNIRLGHLPERYQLSDSVIVLELRDENFLAGIIVNELRDVRLISHEKIEVAPFHATAGAGNSNIINYEAKVDENIIMLIDHNRLILPADAVEEIMIQPGEELAAKKKDEKSAASKSRYEFCPEASGEERRIFLERARSLRQAAQGEEMAGLVPFSVIGLNGEYFGIELSMVREFADIHNVVQVPCCPPHIIGNMNLRGDILTLVDIRAALKMPMTGGRNKGKVIVVQNEEIQAGIYVDDVFDVIYLAADSINKVPAAVQSISRDYLKGTALYRDKMLSVVDLSNVLLKGEIIVEEAV